MTVGKDARSAEMQREHAGLKAYVGNCMHVKSALEGETQLVTS